MEISQDLIQKLHDNSLDIDSLRNFTYRDVTSIDHLDEPISYSEFFSNYLLPNKACILGCWATAGWTSRLEWVTQDGKPDVEFLRERFGKAECSVANCGVEQYSTHPKQDMTVSEYLDYLHDYQQKGYPPDMPSLYLKDWHFTRLFPDYKAYSVPQYFSSDWLNEFYDQRNDENDDYRFVYFGPKGTWTAFHSDVLRSYSWSANIVGRKRWIFYPPGEEEHLKDRLGNLPYDLESPELNDQNKYPNVKKLAKRFELIQNPGEVIFVPSGWHHQVFNLEDTISINHNWLNACNIDLAWRHVKSSLADVQKEISDCLDMEGWAEQCQLILKCSAGINCAEFYNFVASIAENRLGKIKHRSDEELRLKKRIPSIHFYSDLKLTSSGDIEKNTPCKSSNVDEINEDEIPYYELRKNTHILFDLCRIKFIITDMIALPEIQELAPDLLRTIPSELLLSIDCVLHECCENI